MSGFAIADIRRAMEDGMTHTEQQTALIRALGEIEALQGTVQALQGALKVSRHLALIREQKIRAMTPPKYVEGVQRGQ